MATLDELLAETKVREKQPPKGFLGKASDLLDKPEQLAREGLGVIAGAVPSFDLTKAPDAKSEFTRNLIQAGKLVGNVPKLAAETLAETAPEFISKEAILTGGALKGAKAAAPAIKAVGRAIGSGAERLSGLSNRAQGVLAETTANPRLLFKPGIEKARKAFETAKEGLAIRPELASIKSISSFVTKAVDLAKQGLINPLEALEARKALGAIKNRVSPVFFRQAREALDTVAKTKFSGPDKAFQEAVKADALRRFFPVGKLGDISQVRTIGGAALGGLKGVAGLSPIVQGTTASGIGAARIAARPFIQNPRLGVGAVGATSRLRELFDQIQQERR